MNRCHHLTLAVLPVLSLLLSPLAHAEAESPVDRLRAARVQAPERIPPIARTAKLGLLKIVQPPEALLDGQPVRLSPGSRIRGLNNLIMMSGTLIGQELNVAYVRDPLGLVHEVWILTDLELQARRKP